MTIFVITAHPDDLELSCLAYILHRLEHGDTIKSVVVACGRRSGRFPDGQKEIKVRREEAINAAEIAGIGEPIFLDEYIALLDYNSLLYKFLPILKDADLVLTHFPIDPHFDHALIGTVLHDMFQNFDYKFELRFFRSVESYSFIADEVFPVAEYLDKKWDALYAHESQGFRTLTKACVKPTEEFIQAKRRVN